MNDNDTVLQMLMAEWRECPMSHVDRLADLQRRIADHFQSARPAATERDTAAGELLRVGNDFMMFLAREVVGDHGGAALSGWMGRMGQALSNFEAFERAGVTP